MDFRKEGSVLTTWAKANPVLAAGFGGMAALIFILCLYYGAKALF